MAKVNKMEIVRQALEKKPDMKAADAVAYILEKYEVDITPAVFASYRSKIKGESGGTKKEKKSDRTLFEPSELESPAKPARPANGFAVANGTGAPVSGLVNPLVAAQQVAALVRLYGRETVKGLCDVVA